MNNLSILLRLYRQAQSIGVRGLADEIGVSPATISRIENGNALDMETWNKVENWLFSSSKLKLNMVATLEKQ